MEFSEVERKAYELDPTRWVDAPRVREFVHIDPQADLEIDTQSALGTGGFGRCMKALLKRGGGSTGAYEHVNVAVKMLFASTKVTEDLLKTFYVEAYQMSQLVHPNVVLLHGACCRPPHLVLVQELAELGRCAALCSVCTRSPARPGRCAALVMQQKPTHVAAPRLACTCLLRGRVSARSWEVPSVWGRQCGAQICGSPRARPSVLVVCASLHGPDALCVALSQLGQGAGTHAARRD
jgi:Protein tyrosine and serine/threonine kinase